MNRQWTFATIVFLSSVIVWAKLTPHAANWSPVLALILICGFLGKGRWWALAIPMLALGVSDFILGFYSSVTFVYLPLMASILIGQNMSGSRMSTVVHGLAAASLFFVVSNFGVWFAGQPVMYSKDLSGLWQCYAMALPFFRSTIISTLMYLSLFQVAIEIYHRKPRQLSWSE
jgi:hypothetical protein